MRSEKGVMIKYPDNLASAPIIVRSINSKNEQSYFMLLFFNKNKFFVYNTYESLLPRNQYQFRTVLQNLTIPLPAVSPHNSKFI